MKVNPDIFKANDIRGVYPDALDDAVAYAVGRAFVTLLKVNEVVVGRDMRLCSPPMFDALTQGLIDGGADVLNIGMVSTDQYYYACATLESGWHNGDSVAQPTRIWRFQNGETDASHIER